MKTRIISITIILIVGVLLFSYATNNTQQPDNNIDADALRTEAVETYAASLTGTLVIVPTVSPTLTVSPTSTPPLVTATLGTPEKANPCYNLLWIEDRSIPDGTQLKPNEVFTKTWYVQNNGGCAWAPGFTFSNVGGELMRGQTIKFAEPIPVGAKHEISVKLIAPSGENGLVQSSWRMADENGHFFGDTLSVNIFVGTVTTPTATKAP